MDDEEYVQPSKKGYTVYTKSGCIQCTEVKNFLRKEGVDIVTTIVDCDEYIIEDKPGLIRFLNELAGTEIKMFPVIFFEEEYVGGMKETRDHLYKMLSFSTETQF